MAVTPLQNFRAPTELWDAAHMVLLEIQDDERVSVIVNLEPSMTLSEALRAFLQAIVDIP